MYHEFLIVGRRIPTESDKNPKIYRMKIFAKDKVIARNRFWHYINQLKKIKKTHGEILAIHEIREKHPTTIKNFAILIKYNSALGVHNIYKEYRELTRCDAVHRMYSDVASKYRVKSPNIHVLECRELKASEVRRKSTRQFMNSKIKFPLPHRVIRAPSRRLKSTFVAKRPSTVW